MKQQEKFQPLFPMWSLLPLVTVSTFTSIDTTVNMIDFFQITETLALNKEAENVG